MGNRGPLRALLRIAADAETRGKVKFGQIFLAAPDIDRYLFLDLAHLYPEHGEGGRRVGVLEAPSIATALRFTAHPTAQSWAQQLSVRPRLQPRQARRGAPRLAGEGLALDLRLAHAGGVVEVAEGPLGLVLAQVELVPAAHVGDEGVEV